MTIAGRVSVELAGVAGFGGGSSTFAAPVASLRELPQPDCVKPIETATHPTKKMILTQCHNKELQEGSIGTPAIRVSALTKTIQTATHRVDILRGIDFDVQHGEFVAIMGPSGSGKSTLLGLLAGLDTPTSGKIILDGEDITGLDEDRMALLRGRKVGFVFQSYHLLPTLTAEENVLLPFELTGGRGSTGRSRARDLLESVGLSTAAIIIPSSFPEASSSASPWPAPSWCSRPSFWPTNPPAIWIARTASMFSNF